MPHLSRVHRRRRQWVNVKEEEGRGGQHQRRHNTVNIVIGDIPSHYSSANIYVTLELCPLQMEIPKKSNADIDR